MVGRVRPAAARPGETMPIMTQIQRALDGSMLMAVLLAIPLALLYFALRRRSCNSVRQTVLELLLLLTVVSVFAVTLLPAPAESARAVEWVPFTDLSSSARRTQIVLNAALLAPSGFLAALALPRRLLAGARLLWTALALPVLVEVAQLILPLGRVSAVEDVIMGTIGFLTGTLVAARFIPKRKAHSVSVVSDRPRRDPRMAR